MLWIKIIIRERECKLISDSTRLNSPIPSPIPSPARFDSHATCIDIPPIPAGSSHRVPRYAKQSKIPPTLFDLETVSRTESCNAIGTIYGAGMRTRCIKGGIKGGERNARQGVC